MNSIDIWEIDINDAHYQRCKNYLNLLSAEELTKAKSFKWRKDYIRYIISHISLKMLIKKYTDLPVNKILFKKNIYGKPSLICNSIFFNISHTYNKSIIALTSECEIGIDIEYVNNNFNIDEIINYSLAPPEKEKLLLLPIKARIKEFLSLWTRKEALLKAMGIGIGDYLNQDLENLKSLQVNNTSYNISSYTISKLTNLDSNYIGHIAHKVSVPLLLKSFKIWKEFPAFLVIPISGF